MHPSSSILRIVDAIEMWAERACWIDLVHAALKGNAELQSDIASNMGTLFHRGDTSSLAVISYTDAVRHCKNEYVNVPRKTMSPELVKYLELNLNYLTPGVILGIGSLVTGSDSLGLCSGIWQY